MEKNKKNKIKVLTPEMEHLLCEIYNTLVGDSMYDEVDCRDVIDSSLRRAGYIYKITYEKLHFERVG